MKRRPNPFDFPPSARKRKRRAAAVVQAETKKLKKRTAQQRRLQEEYSQAADQYEATILAPMNTVSFASQRLNVRFPADAAVTGSTGAAHQQMARRQKFHRAQTKQTELQQSARAREAQRKLVANVGGQPGAAVPVIDRPPVLEMMGTNASILGTAMRDAGEARYDADVLTQMRDQHQPENYHFGGSGGWDQE